jgi:hypothetical protein
MPIISFAMGAGKVLAACKSPDSCGHVCDQQVPTHANLL